MKSPAGNPLPHRWGVSSDTGSCEIFWISRTRSALMSISAPISSGGRVATQVLEKLALHADELVDGLDHVHGNTDGTGLVGDSTRDGLTDPPRGVRGELKALLVVELLDGADQTEVALLDQVKEQHAAADIAFWRWRRPDAGLR